MPIFFTHVVFGIAGQSWTVCSIICFGCVEVNYVPRDKIMQAWKRRSYRWLRDQSILRSLPKHLQMHLRLVEGMEYCLLYCIMLSSWSCLLSWPTFTQMSISAEACYIILWSQVGERRHRITDCQSVFLMYNFYFIFGVKLKLLCNNLSEYFALPQ